MPEPFEGAKTQQRVNLQTQIAAAKMVRERNLRLGVSTVEWDVKIARLTEELAAWQKRL